MVRTSYISMRW